MERRSNPVEISGKLLVDSLQQQYWLVENIFLSKFLIF